MDSIMDSLINAMNVLAVNESIHLNEAYKMLYNDLTNSDSCRKSFPEIIKGDWIMYDEIDNYRFGIITEIEVNKIFDDEENKRYHVYLFSEKITKKFTPHFIVCNANIVAFELIQKYIKNINDINIKNSLGYSIEISYQHNSNMEVS